MLRVQGANSLSDGETLEGLGEPLIFIIFHKSKSHVIESLNIKSHFVSKTRNMQIYQDHIFMKSS